MKMYGRTRGFGTYVFRWMYHLSVILVLQFLFKFAQGNGPGTAGHQYFTVLENQSPGTVVGSIVTEASSTYTFSESSKARDYFLLNSQTGEITTKVVIDRENLGSLVIGKSSKFDVLILQHSSTGENRPVEISIEILDQNDNDPTFPKDLVDIRFRENSNIGSLQYIETATDLDAGRNANVTLYEIISGEGPFKLVFDFSTYGDVLIVETTGELDRETTSFYNFTIQARDQGSPQRSGTTVMTIHILDENDNPPTFSPSTYDARVNETDPVGTFVIRLQASDLDAGVNQDIWYFIIDDQNPEADQFRMEKTTGEIFTTKQPLSCKTGRCLLNVEGRDQGVPSYSNRAFVYINIVDTNNHDPKISFKFVPDSNTEFSSISEDLKDGWNAAGIIVSDADSVRKTSVRIIAGNELRHFRLEFFSEEYWFVKVNGDSVLDRERYHMYNLTIEANDNGNPPRRSVAPLIIYVNDINDNPPVFVNKKIKLSMSETTKVGSFIASILATDDDTGINAKLHYNIESGNNPEWFSINQNTGLMTTIAKLHYETRNFFSMNISVHDGALYPFYDYAQLEISIWDENDITPQFSQPVIDVSLEENLIGGAPVATVDATDDDSGLNGSIIYSFHPHVELHYPNTFHLDKSTGGVTTKKSLDREQVANYVIRVIARDQGPKPLSSTATINLQVIDVNDNSPVFYPKIYYAKVIEGQGQDVELVTVNATDADEDENAAVVYSIAGSDFGKFSLHSTTGVLKATTTLRKSERSSYTLSISARDVSIQNIGTATVEITVMSPTDSVPKFTSNKYSFSITEDNGNEIQNMGGNVGSVTAKMDNAAVSIVYTIIEGDPENVFTIDSSSGWIRRSKHIDREKMPSFSLKVVASAGDRFAMVTVAIKVKDINDNAPVFEYPSREVDLIENWPVGYHIVRVSASDPDEIGPNSQLAYSLQQDQNGMFEIDADTGLLYLKKPVKMLGSSAVTLTVVAVDSGTPQLTASQELHLKVKDVNNHTPKFKHTTYEMSLIESHAVNSKFLSVVATDDDLEENGMVTYNITRGNEDKRFGVFPDGYLFIAKELDREAKELYKLSVMAVDMGQVSRSSECNITIHITDFNDNKPIFLNGTYSFSVYENKPPGTFAGYVKASDKDMGRNSELSYHFETDQIDFKIDTQTGEITTLKTFDRELLSNTDHTITFDVVAKDNGLNRLQDVATVRIKIRDENDNPPIFTEPIYKVSVFENAPPFSNITVVRAIDVDAGINSIVTYGIIKGNEHGNFMIHLTKGQISLNRTLDRETEDFYELVIIATDSGARVRYSATTTVQITVSDINDNFPLFAQSHLEISIAEDLEPGSMVGYFPATDEDLGVNGEITYSMSGHNDDQTFGIDSHTGKIYLQSKLDYESKKTYGLNVTATDNGNPPLPYYIRFSISVEDVNDNYPVFQNEPLTFHIQEHSSRSVNQLQAKDADAGNNAKIQYSILYQDPPGDNFRITENSGEIYINQMVDREVANMFTLGIMARDQAQDPALRLSTETAVRVYIDDINDNDPIVTSFNAVAVPIATKKDEFISTITGSDLDDGENSRVSLQLTENSGDYFGLTSTSGRLYLKRSLSTTQWKYPLTVQAKDYGKPQRSSQLDLTVIVVNNDQGPQFIGIPYNGSVVENSDVGKSVLQVRATSRFGSNVEYYLTNITLAQSGQQVDRYFQVDKTTGLLSTAHVLDREKIGNLFEVEIHAIDVNGNQPRSSQVKAQVQLLDVNDTPPKFSKYFYSFDVPETDSTAVSKDVTVDTTIAKVTVYDEDSIGGLQLMLEVAEWDRDLRLKINQNGTVTSFAHLDRESRPQIQFNVTASDGKQSSMCLVRINILDKNDNVPVFTHSFYSFDVNEDTAISTTVGSVRAHDLDAGANGVVRYTLASGWGNDTFSLDSVKGTFTLLSVLDFEESQLYTVMVEAVDSGSPSLTSTVVVYFNVKDANDNTPLFELGSYRSAIFENVTTGTSVIQVVATDVDSVGNVDASVVEELSAGLSSFTVPWYHPSLQHWCPVNVHVTLKGSAGELIVGNVGASVVEKLSAGLSSFTVPWYHPSLQHWCSVNVHVTSERKRWRTETVGNAGASAAEELSLVYQASQFHGIILHFNIGALCMSMLHQKGSIGELEAWCKCCGVTGRAQSWTPILTAPWYHPSLQDWSPVPVHSTSDVNGEVEYSLTDGDLAGHFSIDPKSGVIATAGPLDRETTPTYTIIVTATDMAGDVHDRKFATVEVSVSIKDINDFTPEFTSPSHIVVYENTPRNTVVHVVSIRDLDEGPNSQVEFSASSKTGGIPFTIGTADGKLRVNTDLDREIVHNYTMIVIVKDKGSPSLSATQRLMIQIGDRNDHSPVFSPEFYDKTVQEDEVIGTTLLQVSATDQDAGLNGIVKYFIISGDDNYDFIMDQSSGVIRVQKSLDYERVQVYNLIVQAEDSGDDTLYSTASIVITIVDINDNAPLFYDSPYIGFVRENMDALPVHVLQVSARDDDAAQYNQLRYSILDGAQNLFNMSSQTGEIMALRTLDREVQSQYLLIVIATDSGTGRGLTGTATVSIFVEDVNDNSPVYENGGGYEAHIAENSGKDSTVVTVHASDKDEGVNAQILYSLEDSEDGRFTVFPDTGHITALVPLDREDQAMYTLRVVARDASMLPRSSTVIVTVFVDDTNDNDPVFDQPSYSQTVLPSGTGSFILGLTASDLDVGDNRLIEYRLGPQGVANFLMDTRTGVITARTSLGSGTTYYFPVIATDKGTPVRSSSASVSISVTSSSSVSPPTFNSIPTGLQLTENAAREKTVTTVTAQPANGATITYYIAGGNVGQAFSIVSNTGRIFVMGAVDYEVMPQYRLWIEAQQGGATTVSAFADVTIDITDVNDNAPTFSKTLYDASIYEDAMFGSSVVTVTATDADSGPYGAVQYSLSGMGSENFRIDRNSGKIHVSTYEDLDREHVDRYNLLVIASDQDAIIHQNSATASVRINILDVNDKSPVFARLFRVKIPESMEVGSFALRVTSSDEDIGINAVATYTLTDDADGMFRIEGASGNITLNKPLDAEKLSSYRLRVLATDGAHDVTGNVNIDVSDVNDNVPVIVRPFSFNFPEKKAIGSYVGRLAASDDDIKEPNNQIYFSLKLASSFFHLDSDSGNISSLQELTFNPLLDPSTPPNRHELVVIAKDLGTPVLSSEQTIYINVVDFNDHAPVFEQTKYESAVPDTMKAGEPIITVVARDEQDYGENAQIEYWADGGNGSTLFIVDRYLGTISLKVGVSLAGQRNRIFSVGVKAEDKGMPPLSTSISVRLVITDQNMYAPKFILPSNKQISIAEDTTVGSLIETFRATDSDNGLNSEILYEITSGNNDGLFKMDDNKGTLSVNQTLDYEMSHQYTLDITARDKALNSRHVTISYVVLLTDVNDNDPIFRRETDIIFVEENTPLTSSVYQASASDEDSGLNAQIHYAIVGDSEAKKKFHIDDTSGIVTTKGALDYETRDSYSLMIMALNTDTVHKSTMSLKVYIEGVNEYVPRFVQDSYYFSVSESADPKTSVGKVLATDDDSGDDGIVNYFLIGDSNTKGFKIDPRSGIIYVSGRPDYESSPRIVLDVLAKNWGSVKGNDTDTCTVHISVEDANDPPEFTQSVYNAHIRENSAADVSVTTVKAEDHDVDVSDRQFSYTILSGNTQNAFQINPQTGYVSTTGKGVLDRETMPVITIIVGAKDTGSPPETGSATVSIYLDDVNDNGPYFMNFTARVTEGQAAPVQVTTLIQFTADPDSSGNQGPFSYFYVPAGHTAYEYFEISEKTGLVTTKKELDRESTPEFMVPVIIKDGGSPQKSSTVSFKISITDVNDSPPSPRALTVLLSLYDGQIPQGVIADVKPLDMDIVGKHTCNLVSVSPAFEMDANSCDLRCKEYPVEDSYTLSVSGSDGMFSAVTYDVSIQVLVFNNKTLENSVIVQVAGKSAADFVEKSYTTFITAVKDLFNEQDEVMVFGVQQQASGDLLLFIAVNQGQSQYYYPDILKQKLNDAKIDIGSKAGLFVMNVDYSSCNPTMCKNNGQCASNVSVGASNHVADTQNKLYSSPTFTLVSYCICQPQYTGLDCSQPASPCGDIYCKNEGQCVSNGNSKQCQCPSTWAGRDCGEDKNECKQNVCQNGARCENLLGDFICHCLDGFSGKLCDSGQNYCKDSPCKRGICKNIIDGYVCLCPYGFWGDLCENASFGFGEVSFMEFPKLTELNNEIEVIFATQKENALLLYNPSSVTTSKEFIALEILNGRIRFSVCLGIGDILRLNVDKQVNTGDWYKVKVLRNRETSKVFVEDCPADGGECSECSVGASCFRQGQTSTGDQKLELGTQPLSLSGVRNIDTILNRKGQVSSHDFIGCIRSFIINGQNKLVEDLDPSAMSMVTDECPRASTDNPCDSWKCANGGVCVAEWSGAVCRCPAKYSGVHCDEVSKPFGFGPNTLVKITPREGPRRDALMAAARRRRATATESSILVRFRTTVSDGVLMFVSTRKGNSSSSKFSILSVFDSHVKFTVSQYGTTESLEIPSLSVNGGIWHNATVTVSGSGITLTVDKIYQTSSSKSTFLFTSLEVEMLSLGGVSSAVTIDNKSLRDLDGCISLFELDGAALPMNGMTDRYAITPVGGVESGCSSLCANNACDGQGCSVSGEVVVCSVTESDDQVLSIGIIVVIVFFIVLIIAIVIVFIVFRQRRRLRQKEHTKPNGTIMTSANSSGHSHQDSGYSENAIDDIIIQNHIARELAMNRAQHQNGRLFNQDIPDIIETEKTRSLMPLEMEDGTVIIDNASDLTHLRGLDGEMPEHYDLENASSIAPSDIDVATHYRHFHDGGRNRRKNKSHSNHSHSNSQHSSNRHYHGSNHSNHSHHRMRDSPNLLTSVPFMNDLARDSPTGRSGPSPINQLSRQSPNVRQSPLTHVNMHNHNMPVTDLNHGSRTTSERSLASHRSRNSSSTPNKPKRQMLPNGHPNRKISNNNYEGNKFLTLEDVDRMNARPRESPASLMEAFSTSSENNTRKGQKPFEHYQDTNVLLEPPDSSSDDSANDSFTCSEYECENDKPRNDFDPRNRIFPNLAEVDNENDDGSYNNRNFNSDGLDSGGNSFSSNIVSSDDGQSKSKQPVNPFNWDDLLNWGPKFEKLVGVFTDIALLPDSDSVNLGEGESKGTDKEEYV